MERYKKIVLRMLYPGWIISILLTIFSAAGLVYVFLNDLTEHLTAYIIYVISFYTLCVLVAAIPGIVKKCRKKVYSNNYAARYLTERELRARISLYTGTVVNLAYSVFKLIMGIWFRSVWFGAVAVYYMVLCLIRFLLIRNDRRIRNIKQDKKRTINQWNSYRTCGWLLLILNATMTGMVFQMVWQNKSYSYPGFVIYASAAYTFYRLTMAIVRMIKLKKAGNPLLSAAKALDFSVALMAIFSLQTAMFSSFGGDMSEAVRRLMNIMTGGTVCLAVVCIAVYMLLRSGKVLKIEKDKREVL